MIIVSRVLLLSFVGVEEAGAESGNVVEVKRELKVGKGQYGGGNIDHDPHGSKNNAPSQLLWSFCIGTGFGFPMLLLFVV